MHVYSKCVSECMCISSMIHLWWIKPAVSIERWPRTPCTGGNRRCMRPLSTELPNIAWPSTDHCALLSAEVTIGQICSHNNGITLYFVFKLPTEARVVQLSTESPWTKTLYNIYTTSRDKKSLKVSLDRSFSSLYDAQCDLSYLMPFLKNSIWHYYCIVYNTGCTSYYLNVFAICHENLLQYSIFFPLFCYQVL